MSNCDWSSLPTVVMYEIFNNLNLKDRLKASSTCRKWREAFFFYPNARRLKIRTTPDFEEKNTFLVTSLANFCKELTFVYVAEHYHEVVKLVQCFPDLSGIRDIRFVGSKEPNRQTFESNFNNVIYPFLEKCNHITKLFLSHWVNPERMKRLLFKHHKRLVAIGLEKQVDAPDYTDIAPMLISVLEKCENLEILCLDSKLFTEELMEWLIYSGSLSRLSKITLRLDENNTMGAKFDLNTWDNFHKARPSCEIHVNYVHIQESTTDNSVLLATKITRIRILYCSMLFRNECIARFMPRGMPANNFIESIWSISHPSLDLRLSDNQPIVLCAWRFANLSEMVLSGSKYETYDLIGMSRLRPKLDIHVTYDDIVVDEGNYVRHVKNSELKKHLTDLMTIKANQWIPMKTRGFNDPSIPSADREALAFEETVRFDLT